jgi:hypothetical protein
MFIPISIIIKIFNNPTIFIINMKTLNINKIFKHIIKENKVKIYKIIKN